MIVIDKLCYQSRLRYENPGEKFAFAVITLCICVMSRSIAVACIVLAVTGILTVWKGGIPVSRYLKFLTIPLAFLLLSTLAIILNLKKAPLDLFAIPLGNWYLTSSKAALLYAGQLILTALSSVSCLYFLAFTTPMPDILDVLKKLHCPKLLIELMLLIYRLFLFSYLQLLYFHGSGMSSWEQDYRTALNSFGKLGSVLMIRAMSRSNRLYDAMEARCYDGEIRVLSETKPPKKRVVFAIILFDTCLFFFALWRRFYS